MPQLLPDPWLFIFLSSWTILLLVAPTKILKHNLPNNPSINPPQIFKKTWHWPWS